MVAETERDAEQLKIFARDNDDVLALCCPLKAAGDPAPQNDSLPDTAAQGMAGCDSKP